VGGRKRGRSTKVGCRGKIFAGDKIRTDCSVGYKYYNVYIQAWEYIKIEFDRAKSIGFN